MENIKQERLPSRPRSLGVKDEPAEKNAIKSEIRHASIPHSPTCPYHPNNAFDPGDNVHPQPTYAMAGSPVKNEEYEDDEPPRGNQAWIEAPFQPNPMEEREREAIRKLFDMPEVDVPVWDRRREPMALKMKLMPHQRVGLTWLIKQEQSPHKGGILADDMGLGKTIQALALILARPPEDGTRKTTLIVVPTSLLHQWEQEINDKVKPGHKLKTVIFHSQKKRNMTVTRLLSHDVVLTTYGTLAHEWKRIYEQRKIDGAILLASHAIFHRIILDEAHNIKNRHSQAAKAVDRLRSTYRLCMTGTPLMNRLDELYPLVRFLRIQPYYEWENFRRTLRAINADDPRAMKQLHVLLGRILLRRTEKTMVDGQPILTLPPLTVKTVEAVFDKDQLEYYQALEQRSQIKMNKYLKERTVTRHYWYILLLILRLRQCCCHPYLLKDHTIPQGVNMTPGEMNKLAQQLNTRVVDRIASQKSFECPMCEETIERPIIIYPCGHWICGDCLTNMISVSEPGAEFDGEDGGSRMGFCPKQGCIETVDSKHVICYKNFADMFISDDNTKDRSQDSESDVEDKDESADENGDLKDFVVSDDHESDDDEDDSASGSDNDLDSPRHVPEKVEDNESVKHVSNVDRVDKADDSDDSDESLPPIDMLFSQIKKKAAVSPLKPNAITYLSKTKRNKRNNMRASRNGQRTKITDMESEPSDEDGSAMQTGKRKKSSGKGLARPKKKLKTGKRKRQATELTLGALKKSSSSSARARESYFKGLRKDWETSAKVDSAMEILALIRREFPNEKTLVFSQFTSFLDLMEIPISDDGYNYRRYDGSMSNGDRDAAVNDFMKKPEVKVMLVSLRCGNAGLNLYAATRVIMLDPFWNPSVEDQAIKRAHRLGQTQPVVAYRILVRATIEDRILALQEKKRELVSNVLNPEARNSVSRLSVSELAGLFGINWTG